MQTQAAGTLLDIDTATRQGRDVGIVALTETKTLGKLRPVRLPVDKLHLRFEAFAKRRKDGHPAETERLGIPGTQQRQRQTQKSKSEEWRIKASRAHRQAGRARLGQPFYSKRQGLAHRAGDIQASPDALDTLARSRRASGQAACGELPKAGEGMADRLRPNGFPVSRKVARVGFHSSVRPCPGEADGADGSAW